MPAPRVLVAFALAAVPMMGSHAQGAAPSEQVVAVATRRLARGTVLTTADFTITRAMVRGVDSLARAGWVTRRVIEAGEVLRRPAVAPRPMVVAGQPVLFVMEEPGLRLTLDGRAVGAGELGDQVAVRLGANRTVEGTVTGAGEVTRSVPPRIQ
ncbi:MAG: flagellar basal body P-ring formation protein FlgA [Gemmatimonadaceae bacterium]|nr:flagellar basal body P-ring formation protein FlgA [Gemmatimonadaceae bacterium]